MRKAPTLRFPPYHDGSLTLSAHDRGLARDGFVDLDDPHQGNELIGRDPGRAVAEQQRRFGGLDEVLASVIGRESHLSDSNRGPQLYESCALPTELRWRSSGGRGPTPQIDSIYSKGRATRCQGRAEGDSMSVSRKSQYSVRTPGSEARKPCDRERLAQNQR
jgi:hypothetical protein